MLLKAKESKVFLELLRKYRYHFSPRSIGNMPTLENSLLTLRHVQVILAACK